MSSPSRIESDAHPTIGLFLIVLSCLALLWLFVVGISGPSGSPEQIAKDEANRGVLMFHTFLSSVLFAISGIGLVLKARWSQIPSVLACLYGFSLGGWFFCSLLMTVVNGQFKLGQQVTALGLSLLPTVIAGWSFYFLLRNPVSTGSTKRNEAG